VDRERLAASYQHECYAEQYLRPRHRHHPVDAVFRRRLDMIARQIVGRLRLAAWHRSGHSWPKMRYCRDVHIRYDAVLSAVRCPAIAMRKVLVTLLAVSIYTAVHGQSPTFRSGATAVPILATVTDDDDRLVPGLTAENFEVLDDGKPQTLTLFENEVKPITVVLMLDTSASMTAVLDQVAAAAEQFVIRLLPDDRARLCVFNDSIVLGADFTSDRDALARSVREIDFGNGTRLYDGLSISLDAFKAIDGRKIIVTFTDGADTASRIGRRAVTNRARAEDVMVYAVGFASDIRDGDDVVHTIPDPGLRKLAAETGGGYFEVKRAKDLSSTFTRVLRELHSQYLLAIAPPQSDGRVHKISVQVDRPGASVRARRSYLAPSRSRRGW